MLDLPVPEAEYINEVLKPSEEQKELVSSFADRAEAVRAGKVQPTVDNMLKITNDGRKCALDQRLINPMLPDNPDSKVNRCVGNMFDIWQKTAKDRLTQLCFCDLSTPKGDGSFNVYDDIREKLVQKGIPKEEIAFIHEANTETRKEELFAKVRSGQVRILMGSTPKLGAGTNVQDRLVALHHLDCPWKPADLEQQEGRILRQGNRNAKVQIYRYVTESSFDSYSWQILEQKQKFISQIMTSKSPVRSCEDVDGTALSYAEIKALATGNPYIKEKMDLDIQVTKLKLLKANHTNEHYRLESDIARTYPVQITAVKERIGGLEADLAAFLRYQEEVKEKVKAVQISLAVGQHGITENAGNRAEGTTDGRDTFSTAEEAAKTGSEGPTAGRDKASTAKETAKVGNEGPTTSGVDTVSTTKEASKARNKEKEKEYDGFSMTIGGKEFTDRKEAGTALLAACAGLKAVRTSGQIGEYAGFAMSGSFDGFTQSYLLTLKRQCSYTVEVGKDPAGNIQRVQNALNGIERQLNESRQKLENLQGQLAAAKEEVRKPFVHEAELQEKSARLAVLNSMLNMDEHSPADTLGVDEETDQSIREGSTKSGRDSVDIVADRLPCATSYAEKAVKTAQCSNGDGRSSLPEGIRQKASVIGRLQEKKEEIAAALTVPSVPPRARAEPALGGL